MLDCADFLPLYDDIMRSDLYCYQQEPLAFGLSQCAAQFGFDFPLDFDECTAPSFPTDSPTYFPSSPELCPASPEYDHSPFSESSVQESPERRRFLSVGDDDHWHSKTLGVDSPLSPIASVESYMPDSADTDFEESAHSLDCQTPCSSSSSASTSTTPQWCPKAHTKVRISTQTAVFELNQTVDLPMLARYFPGSIIYDPTNSAFESTKGKKQSFQNQASTQVRVSGHTVSVNIFKNGRVKLAGSRGQVESQMIASHIVSLVRRACGPSGSAVANPASLDHGGFRVVMNKAEFEVPFAVSLVRAQSVLTAAGFPARYNPESYCGLVVSVPNPDGGKAVSVMIFASGKAFVTGNCDEGSVGLAFQAVRDVLESQLVAVEGSAPLRSRKRKPTAATGRVTKRAAA